MTKSKSSALSVVVLSTLVIQLVNDAQFLNGTSVTLISLLTKMQASL